MALLTKEETLEEAEALWRWLAKSGNCYKYLWPGWSRLGPMLADCPLCEYSRSCRHCPLYSKWTSFSPSRCTDDGSPYRTWENSKAINARRKAAKQVADLIHVELEAIK